jgi:bacillithiol system protein YtxJ
MAEIRKLQSIEEIDQLIEQSRARPVMIFKHSLSCPISSMARREYDRYLDGRPQDDPVVHTLIEIQNARPVSNAVAEKTGVRHESPQALLLKDGKVVWHESHGSIRVESLNAAVGA